MRWPRLNGYRPVYDRSTPGMTGRLPTFRVVLGFFLIGGPVLVTLVTYFGHYGPFDAANYLFGASSYLPDVPDIWEYLEAQRLNVHLPVKPPSSRALVSHGAKPHLQTNLREDENYLISFYDGGWNNQVIEAFNQILLAYLSKRIPILPNFSVNRFHVGDGQDLAVGEIFDLNILSSVLDDLPIVELHELKIGALTPERLKTITLESQEYTGEVAEQDDLGCWSFTQTHNDMGNTHPGAGLVLHKTPLPDEVFLADSGYWRQSIGKTASIVLDADNYDPRPASSLRILKDASFAEPTLPPDNHVACIDSAYWLVEQYERWNLHAEWLAGQGVWNRIGKHMYFHRGIEDLRDMYLRKALGLRRNQAVPPYMAVHIRRSGGQIPLGRVDMLTRDFNDGWKALTPRQYAHAAWETMMIVRNDLGIALQNVVIGTDETDPEWLGPLREYGWHLLNHTETHTLEKYGAWLPTILDSCIFSGATGFLGVASSTMSILAMRRVIDWNRGVGRMIRMGHQVPEDWVWTLPE